jgi:hypothetical protein
MTAGIKANNDGSAAIQVGGTDYITISSAGAVAIPVSLTVGGIPSGGNYALVSYTSPNTWDATAKKAAGLKAVKVTVVGGGGDGGTSPGAPSPTSSAGFGGGGGGGGAAILYLDAPAIPSSPITITAGPGTNSFGALASATGGSNGANSSKPAVDGAGGAGGTGSVPSPAPSGAITFSGVSGLPGSNSVRSVGGSSQLFYAQPLVHQAPQVPGVPNPSYGGGGSGGGNAVAATPNKTGGTGGPGIVIVEEFY